MRALTTLFVDPNDMPYAVLERDGSVVVSLGQLQQQEVRLSADVLTHAEIDAWLEELAKTVELVRSGLHIAAITAGAS
jgi:hypothetical protein